MAEYNKSKFFWIRLTDSFLTSDTVDFLMSQEGGANYVVLYQMLCLKTVNNDGVLGRQLGEILIEYDAEKIQRDCKYFSIDTVRVALELYKALGLVYRLENGLLRIAEFGKLIGSTSIGAEKKKEQRENKKALESSQKLLGGQKVDNCPPDIDIDIKKEKDLEKDNIYKSIIDYLNEQIGTHYRPNNKTTQKHINARLSDGYTLIEFKIVIDKMCAKWKGTDMEQYLRPETLFGTKFESYLNAKINTKEVKNGGTTEKFDANSKFDAFFPDETYI